MTQRGLAGLAALIASIATVTYALGAADTTPPTVVISTPRAGDTLTDPTTVSATASDDTGVAGVQFLLDGQPLGREVTSRPYRTLWSITSSEQSGFHRLSAVARDIAGNTATAPPVEVDVQGVNASHDGPHFKPRPLPSLTGRLGISLVDWFVPGVSMVPTSDPTAVKLHYIPLNRDPTLRHDRVWYRTHHPDWVMYRCDRTRPATLFGSAHTVLDLNHAEVREYQLNLLVRSAIKQGLPGVFFDNVVLSNGLGGSCGAYTRDGRWVQRYSDAVEDAAWPRDIDAWLGWMRDKIHALGGYVVANVGYVEDGNPATQAIRESYERIVAKLDSVLVEAGTFAHGCGPLTGRPWALRFDTYRQIVQSGRGLMFQEITCDSLGDLTPELRSWIFANHLLLRGPRSYLAIVPSRGFMFYDGAEYYVPIGAPAGEPAEREGVWTRAYQHGLVAVNPDAAAPRVLDLGSETFVDFRGAPVSGGQLAAGGQLFNGRELTGSITMSPGSGLVLLRKGIDTLTAGTSAGRAPLAVTFTGHLVNGTAGCGQTDWYSLLFGDGTWEFVTVPAGTCGPHRYSIAHTYARPGAYDAVLSRPSRALPARTVSIPLGHAAVKVGP